MIHATQVIAVVDELVVKLKKQKKLKGYMQNNQGVNLYINLNNSNYMEDKR